MYCATSSYFRDVICDDNAVFRKFVTGMSIELAGSLSINVTRLKTCVWILKKKIENLMDI